MIEEVGGSALLAFGWGVIQFSWENVFEEDQLFGIVLMGIGTAIMGLGFAMIIHKIGDVVSKKVKEK